MWRHIIIISSSVRGRVFWACDRARGSRVHRHLVDILRTSVDPELLKASEQRRLRALLTHASTTVPYHHGRPTEPHSLAEWPIVSKAGIRDDPMLYRSSRYLGKRLHVVTTSGSTGSPLRVEQNPDKRRRAIAEALVFNGLAGYEVGDRFASAISSSDAHASGLRALKRSMWLFAQNRVQFDSDLLDVSFVERQRQALLRDRSVTFIIGYPSVIMELARHIIEAGDAPGAFGVRGIICIAEALYPHQRATIQQAFGCIVLGRYSNMECGLLATQCPTCDRHHVNAASYLIEIVGLEDDTPVPAGSVGRIIVTDLFNRAHPLIRYDTGDLGSLGPSGTCPRFATPVLSDIEGRSADAVFDTQGRRLMLFTFEATFERLGGAVRQFQFLQEGPGAYRLRLCVDDTFRDEDSVRRSLLRILGGDARIAIEYVGAIPTLPSGKRRYIVGMDRWPGAADAGAAG